MKERCFTRTSWVRPVVMALTLCIGWLPGGQVHAQGCSDAGVCTMGALKQEGPPDSLNLLRAGISAGYGAGEEGVSVIQVVPEIEVSIVRDLLLQVRIPFVSTSGDLASTSGVGDLAASLTWAAMRKEHMVVYLSLGGKLGTGKTGLDEEGLPLPMPYQPGLGTHDLLVGAAWQYGTWHVGLGYQHVLSHENENGFSHGAWSFDDAALAYFESAGLERANDAILRAEKTFTFDKFRFTPGILAIYRTGEDKVAIGDEGILRPVTGSDGLTLNITASLHYNLSGRAAIILQGGSPAVVRDNRPDGLTRSLAANLKFTYGFLR